MTAAIELKNVTKTFGRTTAVSALDLVVPQGGLYGFIGPNGAGKTTSIRMIMSIVFPDSGAVSILGRSSALEAKDLIGYLPEERGLYRKMRVGAFLTYMARLKAVSEDDIPARIERSLEQVGLGGTLRKRCDELSKGMQQKVQFLAAIIHKPDLLILDEPFSGLDPVSTRQLRELILAEHRRGATILFSTHVMPHAEEICDHVVMIHQGRKVLDEDVAAIRRRYDPRTIRFDPLDPRADVSGLKALPEVHRLDRVDGGYHVVLAEGTQPASIIPRLAATVPPARIELFRPRLEEVFIDIVAGAGASSVVEQELRAGLRSPDETEVAG
jgi:ABC-2 type transport system ATP-binding protein